MIFIPSALWRIRIRGLRKLPNGRSWLGKLGLFPKGKAMLCKSLIQFSADCPGCVPSLLLRRVEAHGLIFSCEDSGITTPCWTTTDRIMLNPTKKRYSTSKSKGGAPADDKKGKIMFRSNPIPARDAQRAQTKFFVHQDPETPQRLSQKCLWVFECLLWRYRSAVACHRGRGSGCSLPGSHSVRPPLTPPYTVEQTTHRTIMPNKSSHC